jgi:hypothetical protein
MNAMILIPASLTEAGQGRLGPLRIAGDKNDARAHCREFFGSDLSYA